MNCPSVNCFSPNSCCKAVCNLKETNKWSEVELLAIMAAIIYSAENASSRKAEVKAAVVKAGEIFQEVKELVQKQKIG